MNILAMLYSAVYLCLAMPELPPETIAQLQLVQSQAQNYTLQSEGVQVYDATSGNSINTQSILFLFSGLYKGLQAWNEWNGGDDYIVKRQYVMERTDLPEWLAEYSGDVIFWELEYFGHTIEMITDKDGKILVDNSANGKGKACNIKINQRMVDAAKALKQSMPDLKNVSIVTGSTKFNTQFFNLKKPYVEGDNLHFFMYFGDVEYHIRVENFVNSVIFFLQTQALTTRNGMIGIGSDSTNIQNVRVFVNDSEVSFYNRNTYRSVINGTYLQSSYTRLYKVLPIDGSPYTNLSFVLPCNYDYNIYRWENQSSVNGNATIQGMISGQSVPIGDSQQIYIGKGIAKEIKGLSNDSSGLVGESISAQSLDDIQNAIAQIEPEVDPDTGIQIIEIPQDFPLPEVVPLEPEPGPIPDGPVYPEFDFPIGDPEQVPESDPETAPTTEPTEINLPENAEEIPVPETLSVVNGLQNRFPFSIPWDIYHALANLSAERQTPHWEWTLNVNMPFSDEVFSYTFVLDLGFMAGTVGLFRNLFLLAFILGLAVYSYNKFFGGGA